MLTLTLRTAISRTVGRGFASSLAKSKEHLDPVQEASLNERCFLVDENDKIIGQASKKGCHLVQKNGDIPLHRAFSVFLFNNKGDLLLQKRSSQKITYPDCYTNSCCSHPIADFPGEDEDKDALGIKRAAQRRLNYELGIPVDSIPVEKLNYVTRIHYKDEGNGKWGEHEIDYVLFLQADVKVKPNPSEISEISFIPRNELDEFIPTLTGPLTPWFQMILKHRLRFWWDNLQDIDAFRDHDKILRLKL
uniref:isopentenyl-diphosphate Delta-isomerase n=1 Tax=Leptinotarsa decemlineata TaxID=7539 RepID=A0A0H4IVW7_LEPDE|nr:isopentenyl diphosphate delta isomerase [Leptinotarsa decemlineata]